MSGFKVTVSDFKEHFFSAETGGSNVCMGVTVVATSGGHEICQEFVGAATQYEPNTKNKGGGIGAYRDIEPKEKDVRAAINRVKAKARYTLKNKQWVETYDGGFWATPKEIEQMQEW